MVIVSPIESDDREFESRQENYINGYLHTY
jgi:hypothetical protein